MKNKIIALLTNKSYEKNFKEIIDYHNEQSRTYIDSFTYNELLDYYVLIGISYQELGELQKADIFYDNFLGILNISKLEIEKIKLNKIYKDIDEEGIKFVFLMNYISELGFTYKVDNKEYQDSLLNKKTVKDEINTYNFLKNTSGIFGLIVTSIGYILLTFIFIYISSKFTNINYLDYFLMILIISPAFHINEILFKEHKGLKENLSNFFIKFDVEFKNFALCLPFIILFFLYKYGVLNGIIDTLLLFFISLGIQRGFYLYIKYYIKNELIIFGLEIIGLILFGMLIL